VSDENQVPADADALPTPVGNGQPQAASDDPATAAFEALREEVALVHHAVAGLAAERDGREIPDYSETLGKILHASAVTVRNLKGLAEMPALRVAPEDMGRQIAAAAETARRADHTTLAQASATFREVTENAQASLRSARAADRQRIWLLATGIAGIVAGAALWGIITGSLIPAAPSGQQSPEQKASAILGMDETAAGEHLIQTASPHLWQDLVLGDRIVAANKDVLAQCPRAKGKRPRRCIIVLPDGMP
jgi:hypothetical protein